MPTPTQISTTAQAPVAGRYWVDPDRTTVTIAARHMFGLGRVTGTVALRDAHPEISFHADAVRNDGSVLAGTLIAHGAAAATQVRVEQVEQFDNVLMVRANARIDRYAHGVTAGRGVAGRWIDVRIDATCYRMGSD